ncbi:alpha/beta hydrolase [Actinoplanes sp. NPDC049596]|uniref:alpha/beta fold hydrolase n=1 Tax=unclassified Actinoplanes TaxID=2626549 RepID=UPI0034242505
MPSVEFTDGRRVAVRQSGDPDGTPVVFHHGTPASRLAAGLVDAEAERHGVRLVAFDRPGYADAPVTPPGLASVGADALRIADALGIGQFATAGVSGGGPYALATALADPDRVTHVAVAAGIGPWSLINPADLDDPERDLLALAEAGQIDEALAGFRTMLAADNGPLPDIDDDDALIAAFLDGAPPDDFAWLDGGKRRLWAADLRAGLPSLDGYARDNVSWGARWDIDVSAIRVPVHLYYGDRDRLVTPANGHWHAEHIPTATMTWLPGAGHGTASYGHWDTMLSELPARA